MSYHFMISNSKKLLEIYYNVKMSPAFAACADKQLVDVFERTTSVQVKDGVGLGWRQEDAFNYHKGEVSTITINISLKYGFILAKIAWKSNSGRIYDIADEDILCDDIMFWFEEVDPEDCYKKMYPIRSLFTFPEITIESFNKKHNIPISLEFINCADRQLSPFFEKTTGLKFNKHIGLSIGEENHFLYTSGIISKLSMVLYINHNWNYDIYMTWKSKSGHIYKPGDADIDCNDIEFGLEGLDPVLYHKQMYPKAELPFKLKNLSYKLVINRLNMDCTMEMILKKEIITNAEGLIKKVDDFINRFNEESVKKNREEGVIHNWNHRIEGDKLIYNIDTGFAGLALTKKLLPFLSMLNSFEIVEIN